MYFYFLWEPGLEDKTIQKQKQIEVKVDQGPSLEKTQDSIKCPPQADSWYPQTEPTTIKTEAFLFAYFFLFLRCWISLCALAWIGTPSLCSSGWLIYLQIGSYHIAQADL